MRTQTLLDTYYARREELLEDCEIARLYNNADLRGMATQKLQTIIHDNQNLIKMGETITDSLASLDAADLLNVFPGADEDLLHAFERHKAAGTLREWFFIALSHTQRRALLAYTGGGQ